MIWINIDYDEEVDDMISLVKYFDADQVIVAKACIRFRSPAVGSLLATPSFSLPSISLAISAAVACGANGFKEIIVKSTVEILFP